MAIEEEIGRGLVEALSDGVFAGLDLAAREATDVADAFGFHVGMQHEGPRRTFARRPAVGRGFQSSPS